MCKIKITATSSIFSAVEIVSEKRCIKRLQEMRDLFVDLKHHLLGSGDFFSLPKSQREAIEDAKLSVTTEKYEL